MNIFSLFLLFSASVYANQIKKLPNFYKTCKQRDPGVTKCMLGNIMKIRQVLVKDSQALGISSVEPLKVAKFSVPKSVFGVALDFTNIKVQGLTKFRVRELGYNPELNVTSIRLSFAKIKAEGHYSANGDFGGIRINSKGKFHALLKNLSAHITLRLGLVKKNGNETWRIKQAGIKIKVKSVTLNVQNFDKLNEYMKNHFEVLNALLMPKIEKALEHGLTQWGTDILSQYKAKDILA